MMDRILAIGRVLLRGLGLGLLLALLSAFLHAIAASRQRGEDSV